MPDAEIEAMGKVADALGGLEEEARARVLRWAGERYGVVLARSRTTVEEEADDEDLDDGDQGDDMNRGGGAREYEHFAELYDAAGAATDAERVLIAAYWT
jgi:hypothetical protein